MTDRINILTVALAADIRDDDIKPLIGAIGMMRGVLAVTPHVCEPSDWLAQERARAELRDKLWAVLYPKTTGD